MPQRGNRRPKRRVRFRTIQDASSKVSASSVSTSRKARSHSCSSSRRYKTLPSSFRIACSERSTGPKVGSAMTSSSAASCAECFLTLGIRPSAKAERIPLSSGATFVRHIDAKSMTATARSKLALCPIASAESKRSPVSIASRHENTPLSCLASEWRLFGQWRIAITPSESFPEATRRQQLRCSTRLLCGSLPSTHVTGAPRRSTRLLSIGVEN